jgi:hypothetical protein
MSRAGIEQYLYLLDHAFESSTTQEHGLLTNLASVSDDEWIWIPGGGRRCIAEIAEHVGECKFMYANHAFGDGKMDWHEFDVRYQPLPGKGEMINWLREGQTVFRGCVEGLAEDSELLVMRKSNWGQEYETRWLIAAMIEHDLYHAGEINHIRALAQGNDAWPDYD